VNDPVKSALRKLTTKQLNTGMIMSALKEQGLEARITRYEEKRAGIADFGYVRIISPHTGCDMVVHFCAWARKHWPVDGAFDILLSPPRPGSKFTGRGYWGGVGFYVERKRHAKGNDSTIAVRFTPGSAMVDFLHGLSKADGVPFVVQRTYEWSDPHILQIARMPGEQWEWCNLPVARG
jgi:hypothetical protein